MLKKIFSTQNFFFLLYSVLVELAGLQTRWSRNAL